MINSLSSKKEQLTKVIDPFVYIYFTVFFIFSNAALATERYANFVAVILMGLLLIYGIIEHSHVISTFSVLYAAFSAFCFLSTTWAIDHDMAMMRAKTVFRLFVLAVLLYNYCASEKKRMLIVNAVFVAGVFYACFYYLYYGHKEIIDSILTGSRIGADINDQNGMSFSIAMSMIVGMYYLIFEKKYWTIPILLFGLSAILATGSREGFICFFAGLFILVFLRARGWRKLIAVGVVVALVAALYLMRNLPFLAPIMGRMEEALATLSNSGDGSSEIRIGLIKLGLSIFKEHPVLGVGMGGTHSIAGQFYEINYYLHNNYAELLACGGAVGFILYYALNLTGSVIGLAKKKLDNCFYLALALNIVLLISEMTNVSYYDKVPSIIILNSYVALVGMRDNA